MLLVALFGLYYKLSSDKNAYRYYQQGMGLFKDKKYSDAYYNFKQINSISKIYELALLKQYQCAFYLNDKKTSLIKLREIIKTSKNEYIKPWALYQEAILSQEMKIDNSSQSGKKFKHIKETYPKSDFAIASSYKWALIAKETTPNTAKESFLKYLSYAPNGKFSQGALEELQKLNVVFTAEDYEIIADAKFANGQYQSAIDYYQKTSFSKNWYKIAKSYQNLKNKDSEKQTILKGLNLSISNVEEKDLSSAIDRLIILNGASKIQLLQELYTKYPNSYIFPTVVYKLAETSGSIRAYKLYDLIVNEYPASIWASNALWEVFWYNYQEGRYKASEQIAKKHMDQYAKTQDSPRVAYWYGKTLLKSHKSLQAKDVFLDVIKNYPLSYYSFMSARELKKSKAKKMIVKKQIIDYDRTTLNKLIFKDRILLELASLDDWDLIDNFKINDEYIKSWIAYQKGNYPLAINLAKEELLGKKNETSEEKENPQILFSNQMLKMVYPIFYEEEINIQAHKLKQSPYLFLSLVREESHFDKNAKSSAGATGLSQLMQPTASFIEKKSVSKETLLNPNENIKIGLKYFNYLVEQFNGNEYLAILAYNAGPGNIKKWLNDVSIKSSEIDIFVENIPYLETKNYIKKILSSYWIYLNIYSSKNK
ncbi:MAG: transglycosylase SLT domain-containing protein [Candidatus Gastranaerophilales bacterium]|nr:transglycosylase SLT domain-containing protein [Candidatus Gastranaerophilales bacterium]